ncbi:hypothetical protein F5Y07DRAFT_211959 [Xylaria sp. FL0933]|nr:hypothetical protein F5Y07DRAFT_211959 [Xylaria sp. FL0933]
MLCGQWDDSRTIFQYVAIPVADTNDQTARTDEIIVGNQFTPVDYARGKLTENMRKFTIVPQPLPCPRATDLIIRRHATVHAWSSRTHKDVDISFIDGLVQSLKTLKGTIFCYSYTPGSKHEFAVSATRIADLNHTHEDPAEGRNCGQLRFAVHPFIVALEEDSGLAPLIITDRQRGSEAPEVRYKANTFKTKHAALVQCFQHWNNMRFSHDMVAPRDEWSISIAGIADIRLHVERIFLDEYDSDDDETTEDESHSFVDVLDIVIEN